MSRVFLRRCITCQIRLASDQLGELGKGAGKGGGGGGSVREAGGAFGKREASEEERYFRQKEKEHVEALGKYHAEESPAPTAGDRPPQGQNQKAPI